MKKNFITGLVILLPLALTLVIVMFIFNLLTEPFVGIFKPIFAYFGIFNTGFLIFSADQIQKYISQLMILVLLFFCTVGLGLLARWFFIHYLIRFWDYVIYKIPFISSVYRTCQDIITTLFNTDANSFKQVVLAPFPSKETLAIGLVTRQDLPSIGRNKQPLVAVFVPTTPNPTSGFLLMFEENDLIYLDMKVEEALKYVISCGVIATPLLPLVADKTKLKREQDTDLAAEEP